MFKRSCKPAGAPALGAGSSGRSVGLHRRVPAPALPWGWFSPPRLLPPRCALAGTVPAARASASTEKPCAEGGAPNWSPLRHRPPGPRCCGTEPSFSRRHCWDPGDVQRERGCAGALRHLPVPDQELHTRVQSHRAMDRPPAPQGEAGPAWQRGWAKGDVPQVPPAPPRPWRV